MAPKTETKKPHWTQTPEGRAKISRASQLGWARKKGREALAEVAPPAVTNEAAAVDGGGPLDSARLLDLARRGAAQRLIEVDAEAAQLRAFLGQ